MSEQGRVSNGNRYVTSPKSESQGGRATTKWAIARCPTKIVLKKHNFTSL